ncbi:hypothetical protein ACPUYX_11920 [Desulfosporosinus sp. SYSU MS00001]|uniref:hypothetical protein n=1 Tax=Desulfosporosinus sp. SYSU MS00001 TaxID=3416284 RepID=UPI003CFAB761
MIIIGYYIFKMWTQNKNVDVNQTWENVVNEVSLVPFLASTKTIGRNLEMPERLEYQQEVLILLKVFSDELYKLDYLGRLIMDQYDTAHPKTLEEGIRLAKDCQKKTLEISNQIAKLKFSKEIIIRGKKYTLTREMANIELVKGDYIIGFRLASEGFGHAALYFKNQKPGDLVKIRRTFTQANETLFKGMYNMEILKSLYSDTIDLDKKVNNVLFNRNILHMEVFAETIRTSRKLKRTCTINVSPAIV